MIFDCEVTANKDGFGVEWCEARANSEWLVLQVGKGAYYLGFFGLLAAIGAVAFGVSGAVIVLPVLLLGVGFGLAWIGYRLPAKQRAIYFSRGGAIRSPYGLFDGSHVQGAWRTKLGDVANFEVEQVVQGKPDDDVNYTHGVRMVLRSGRVHHVAGNLEPDDAHMVAYCLSQARELVRFDVETPEPRTRSRSVTY